MFNRIIIGVDGSPGGQDAIALARQLAGRDAELILGHVHGSPPVPEQLFQRDRDSVGADVELRCVAEPAVGRGLRELAVDAQADLLVIGSWKWAPFGRLRLGEDALAVLDAAPCPVAIAPMGYATGPHPLRTLGIGWDDSPESEYALAVARDLAAPIKAQIRALCIISFARIPRTEAILDDWPGIADRFLNEELRRFQALEDVDGEMWAEEPSDGLARLGEQVDLLLVGSHSFGHGARNLCESTVTSLARRLPCPMLVLPHRVSADRSDSAFEGVGSTVSAARVR